MIRPVGIWRLKECLYICLLRQPKAVQLTEFVDRVVLGGREPGVVSGHGVAVVADFKGEQGEDLVDEGGGEGFVNETELVFHDGGGRVGGEEVGDAGSVLQLGGEALNAVGHTLAVL